MSKPKKFDAIIIGSGQAGNPLARKLAKQKWNVAIIEKEHLGGTCINTGCTPTKTMIASAERLHLIETADRHGIRAKVQSVDFKAVHKRKDFIVNLFKTSTEKGLKEYSNIAIYMGEAVFTGKKTVSVTSGKKVEEITADYIFINTGAKTLIPEIEGLNEVPYLTSSTILDLEEVPKELLIMGGGYISLEFGQMFSRFGSKVTILEQASHLLKREDEDACEVISEVLKKEGIKVETGAKVEKASAKKGGKISLTYTVGGKSKEVAGTHLLVAVGRKPNTDTLNLALTGLTTDERGYIPVNAQLETKVKGIYVLGDAKKGPAFTHVAYNDHLLVFDHIIHKKRVNAENRVVPYCMFTDPQMGRIGLNEMQAREKGLDIKVAKIPMRNVARAIEIDRQDGYMKAIVDAKTHRILGATVISSDGGEMSTALQIAMMGKLKYEDIRYAMFAHPTMMESFNNLFMTLDE